MQAWDKLESNSAKTAWYHHEMLKQNPKKKTADGQIYNLRGREQYNIPTRSPSEFTEI